MLHMTDLYPMPSEDVYVHLYSGFGHSSQHVCLQLIRTDENVQSLPVQDMDMGVLFCTYSLLNQKSKSTKEVAREVERNPTAFADVNITDIHERKAAHEASKAELEFGEAWLSSRRPEHSLPAALHWSQYA